MEPQVLVLRAELARALSHWVERERLTQTEAAARLGITQPRVSEIVRGRVQDASIDYLVALCARAGIDVKLRA